MDGLKVTAYRQLNMRALPNLLPGENIVEVSADSMHPGLALRLCINYEVNGEAMNVARTIAKFPHYFRVDVVGIPEEKLLDRYYLKDWGGKHTFNLPEHPLRMHSMELELVPLASVQPDPSALSTQEAEAFFRKTYPLPNEYHNHMVDESKIPEHESEVSGFLPQIPRTADQPTDPREYYNWLVDRMGTGDVRPPKADEGVDPVEMLCQMLPRAQGLRTLGICNALAHFKDRRAIPALLQKWEQASEFGPGSRYIPDALAAIGDPSVVPALARRAKELRFDFRVHIAHALGILGGEKAREALQYLALNDPNVSVRGEASRALQALTKGALEK